MGVKRKNLMKSKQTPKISKNSQPNMKNSDRNAKNTLQKIETSGTIQMNMDGYVFLKLNHFLWAFLQRMSSQNPGFIPSQKQGHITILQNYHFQAGKLRQIPQIGQKIFFKLKPERFVQPPPYKCFEGTDDGGFQYGVVSHHLSALTSRLVGKAFHSFHILTGYRRI